MNRTGVSIVTTKVFAAALMACLVSAGCQSTLPAGPSGVLSVVQQKTLDLATRKALDDANISPEHVQSAGLRVKFNEAEGSDLGKNFVAGVVRDHLQGMDAAQPAAGGGHLDCQVVLAGVDITQGGILIVKTISTGAEVQLRFRDPTANPGITEGTGTARHKQTWVFGFGPSVELK